MRIVPDDESSGLAIVDKAPYRESMPVLRRNTPELKKSGSSIVGEIVEAVKRHPVRGPGRGGTQEETLVRAAVA